VKAQARLIEDLLDVSRIITGKLPLNLRPTRLSMVIESALETVRPAADAKNIVFDVDLGGLDTRSQISDTVYGDAYRLQQVVWNLLANAVKFTPKKGTIQVRLEQVNSHLELSVADNGEGISPEYLPHLFNRFSQADSGTTRIHGGLGLGLAIVRHIVELHGGSVRAESGGKGLGARFVVCIPITSKRAITGSTSSYRRLPAGDALKLLEGLRILIVDDEPDNREFVAIALQQWGATTGTASSADEAMKAMDELKPDVLISDIGMPGEDGLSLIGRVRKREQDRGRDIPAIALTAYARAEDRIRILSAGFQMHIPKPVDPAELATVVATLIRRGSE